MHLRVGKKKSEHFYSTTRTGVPGSFGSPHRGSTHSSPQHGQQYYWDRDSEFGPYFPGLSADYAAIENAAGLTSQFPMYQVGPYDAATGLNTAQFQYAMVPPQGFGDVDTSGSAMMYNAPGHAHYPVNQTWYPGTNIAPLPYTPVMHPVSYATPAAAVPCEAYTPTQSNRFSTASTTVAADALPAISEETQH